MLKQIKYVKVYWNDEMGTRPSYYPDLTTASTAIDKVLTADGCSASAMRISIKPEIKVLNMDNPADKAWYDRHIGKTCADLGQYVRPVSVEQIVRQFIGKTPKRITVQTPTHAAGAPVTNSLSPVGMRPNVWNTDPTVNPDCRAAGIVGGAATRGVKRSPAPDRRPRGSVRVYDMNQLEKREYWRWAAFRKRQRRLGQTPIAFAEYKALETTRA